MHGGWVHDRLREEHDFYGYGCSKAKGSTTANDLSVGWFLSLLLKIENKHNTVISIYLKERKGIILMFIFHSESVS